MLHERLQDSFTWMKDAGLRPACSAASCHEVFQTTMRQPNAVSRSALGANLFNEDSPARLCATPPQSPPSALAAACASAMAVGCSHAQLHVRASYTASATACAFACATPAVWPHTESAQGHHNYTQASAESKMPVASVLAPWKRGVSASPAHMHCTCRTCKAVSPPAASAMAWAAA
jgi:hypothetical protein